MRSVFEAIWWRLERFEPAPGRSYTSGVLLLVCPAYSLPLAAFAYSAG